MENLQKEMTFEEVKHFFSECKEYEVSKHDDRGTLKIKLKCIESVDVGAVPDITYFDIETLIYKPTIQRLIRNIGKLNYLKHSKGY